MTTTVSAVREQRVNRWVLPGLLFAGPAAVIVASAITAIFVVRHPDGLVAADYYKQGKAINAKLGLLENARALGLAGPQIRLADGEVRVRFTNPDMREPVAWVLAHPVDPARDLRGIARKDETGDYVLRPAQALGGHRNLLMTDVEGARWRVEARLSDHGRRTH